MKYFLLISALICCTTLYSQEPVGSDSTIHQVYLRSGLVASSSSNLPFWINGNNSQRLDPNMPTQLYGGIYMTKELIKKPLDFYYGLEFFGNFNGSLRPQLIQSYIGINNEWLSLTLGKKEEVFGLNERELGFGSLVNGNNALPIPKVSIKTNGWVKAPFLKNNLSYRGYFAHGWFEKDRFQSSAFLHQKYFYLSAHTKSKSIELQVGLTHNAQWGGQNLSSESRQPTGFKNYLRILLASSGGDDALQTDKNNALGNHLGTWDLKGKIKIGNWFVSNYWQFLWEDSSGLTPFNWRDGKMGVSLESTNKNSLLNAFNIEIIRTNDQDAEKTSKEGIPIFEPDNFLNNSVYRSGWTYKGNVIGSPVFLLLDPESTSSSRVKNMVNAVSISITGNIYGLEYYTSFRVLENGGTRFESIEPKLKVSSVFVSLKAPIRFGSFLIQGEYDWGNYLGRNIGVRLEYQVNLASLMNN